MWTQSLCTLEVFCYLDNVVDETGISISFASLIANDKHIIAKCLKKEKCWSNVAEKLLAEK